MTESLGTAALYVTVDTEQMAAGVAKAKASIAGLSSDAQAQFDRMSKAQQRAALSAVQFGENLGKTRAEIRALAAEQKIGGALGKEIAASIRAQEVAQGALAAATGRSAKEFNKFGLSARQQAAAMRGLPAQITDIATALGSGQRPLTVLLQQGGQLKDMFGGIVPAARAMGGALLGLVNPATLAAAAVVGLGVAWAKAESEAASFTRALVLTGNQANLTTDQLRGMASEIDRSTSATAGKASAVLAQVAATGKFTADQINLISQAAINLESATGRSIENTVAEFASLAKDPLDAILKLNEAIGDGTNVTNFLTEAQLRAIEKFKEQGNEAAATKVAIEAYADAINSRAPEVVANLTQISSVFRDIKHVVGETTDSVVGFFRDLDSTSKAFFQNYGQQVKGLAEALDRLKFVPGAGIARFFTDSFADNANKPDFSNVRGTPGAKPVNSQQERERMRARDEFDRLHLSNLSKEQKLEAEIARIKELGVKAGKSKAEISAEVAAARARAVEGARSGGGSRRRSSGGSRSARLFPAINTEAAQAELARLAEAEARAAESFKDIEAQLQGPMAVAIRDHAKRVEELNELAAKSPEASARLSAALELEAKRHADVVKEIEAQQNPMKLLLDDMAFELDLIGKSNAERAVMVELRRQNIDAMSAEGQAAIATAKQFDEEAKAKQRSIDLMDDFRQGAADALADFVTGAKSAKEAFADFFDDLARRITQMIAERWIEQAFGAMGSDGSGTSGGGWLSAIAGLFANAKGNAFNNGQVMAFANGGVVNGPTFFPMRNGTGLMGEAGPEAIVPLHRGPDGKLGIRMEGGGGRSVAVSQNIYVTGTVSPYAAAQMQQEAARKQRIATSRNG